MNLSYWEKKSWFTNVDFCVVGSGIVGLSCALQLKNRYPKAKVLVVEKGILPQGASTKNAGFACFGSVSEILDDLRHISETQIFNLVTQRVEGLNLLIDTLGKSAIDYKQNGGYELFLDQDKALMDTCLNELREVNELLQPIFRTDIYQVKQQKFNFRGIQDQCIYNKFEAQIDTGQMMFNLLQVATQKGIIILNSTELKTFEQNNDKVSLQLNEFECDVSHLFIATNAFTTRLLQLDIVPARNQVIITTPIKNLNLKGTFHLDRGYYYFRNIDNRILLGGGRHLDSEQETTDQFGLTNNIQQRLEELLEHTVLPEQEFEVDMKWSGILGTGPAKEPIVKSISGRVHCGVRLGGMGVAIGSSIGKRLAGLI